MLPLYTDATDLPWICNTFFSLQYRQQAFLLGKHALHAFKESTVSTIVGGPLHSQVMKIASLSSSS